MRAKLLLALHFHQPVGNFDSVFRDAVRLCYDPLVAGFERHAGVRAAFHLSGCLLEWLEAHDRAFLDRVTALVGGGRIEPLGGGFYEPILPAIPRADALEQLARLSEWWRRRAGVEPRGAWIAERVWEPGLAELLAEAGILYTILDDQHLRFAGLLDPRFSGAFVTERGGRSVAFFPSDFRLRYLIPFRPVEAVRQHFLDLPPAPDLERPTGAAGDARTGAAGPGSEWVLTYGDDAEKFGLWPGTHAWVHAERWLEKFLTLLERDDSPVRTETPGAYLASRPPARKVYVPNASYTEMLEWALPAESAAAYARARAAALAGAPAEEVRAFVRGSLWDMFLSRYPEADQIHKHALWTGRRVRALPDSHTGRAQALTHVLRAQCNCAYWHGLFGGIYFPHLRHGVAANLLAADAILAASLPGAGDGVQVEVADYDGDLEPEIILRSPLTQAFFRPSDGGTLVELDFLPARFNVTNVVSRWKESYHLGADQTHAPAALGAVASPHEKQVGVRPQDLEGRHFDAWPLRSLRDFRCAQAPSPAGLAAFSGMDLARGRVPAWDPIPGGFRNQGQLGGLGYRREAAMEPSGGLRIRWEVAAPQSGAGTSAPGGAGWFGTLLCLSLLAREAPDRTLRIRFDGGSEALRGPGEPLLEEKVAGFTLEDRAFGFVLDLVPVPAVRLVAAPIETLQRSEDRLEDVYQGTLFALCWPLEIAGQERTELELRLSFREL